MSHDYSVLDVIALKDPSGAISDKLILVRNPWAEDSYNGTFSNKSDFSTFQLKQVPPSYLVSGDGLFLMRDTDFVDSFQVFEINRYFTPGKNFTSNFQTASKAMFA